MNVLVLGASGGIGKAIIHECQTRYPTSTLHGTYFNSKPTLTDNSILWYRVDVSSEEQIQALAEKIQTVDWIINCVGLLHDDKNGPEKSLNSVDSHFYLKNITTNSLPTLLIAKHFNQHLKKSNTPKLATVSARVGSIEDNKLGGWYSYRASKAALNMLLKTISIEWQRTLPKAVVLSLHPGTTDTPLSKPFQANVPQGKLFTPSRVANDLIQIVENSTPEESGSFFSYSGDLIPW